MECDRPKLSPKSWVTLVMPEDEFRDRDQGRETEIRPVAGLGPQRHLGIEVHQDDHGDTGIHDATHHER